MGISVSLDIRQKIISFIPVGMEGILFLMIGLSPWVYGAALPEFEFLLSLGIGGLLILWAVRILLTWQVNWQKCPVFLSLALLVVLIIWQITPLSRPILEVISPTTAQIYQQLFPEKPEVFQGGQALGAVSPGMGATLSLAPGATSRHLIRVLALLAVFAVVRNNLDAAAVLRRLSFLALGNGFALALFGIIQFLSSPPHLLYWTFPTGGSLFGPFICRCHFAMYINLCMGLGSGILWEVIFRRQANPKDLAEADTDWRDTLRFLHNPGVLWIGFALIFQLASVFFCLSRGGVLALGTGVFFGFLFLKPFTFNWRRLGPILLGLGLTGGLIFWLGWKPIQGRLNTLVEGKAFLESRWPLWANILGVIRDYPLWGIGFGAYPYLEPMYRTQPLVNDYFVDHLHNEYLEMLVEGGFLALGILVMGLGWIYRLAFRALHYHRGNSSSGLIVGALLGFTTLIVHSLGEFGVHLPAIALLATVVGALLAGLGSPSSSEGKSFFQKTPWLSGIIPVWGATLGIFWAILLVNVSWRENQAEQLQRQAFVLSQEPSEKKLHEQVTQLQAAVQWAPWNGECCTDLALAYFDLYTLPREKDRQPDYLLSSLRHYYQARTLCPLKTASHLALGMNQSFLQQADPQEVYLQRVQFLAPQNPDTWFLCGGARLQAGYQEKAWENWHHSLELSERYLTPIVQKAQKHLTVQDILEKILPDHPRLFMKAALLLYPRPEDSEARIPFLERSLVLLDRQSRPLPKEDLLLQARILKSLYKKVDAVNIYRELLRREPLQASYRQEIAQLWYEENRLPEARRELLTLLAQHPNHGFARTLLAQISRDLVQPR